MFGFLYKNKTKAVMRTKIIAVYLDNYIRMDNGTKIDEWGNNWIEKSYNDSIRFFRDNETNIKYKFKIDLKAVSGFPRDANNITTVDIYSVLYSVYFDGKPSYKEINKLIREYENEKIIRGLKF